MPAPGRSRLLAACVMAGLAATVLVPATAREDPDSGLGKEALEWLRGYLRIETANPPGNEGPAASYLARILHREGIATRLLVTPQGRTNLYARLTAREPKGGPLVLLHHMDVVPPGEGWTRPPWEGKIADGRMWGRGAIDAKSLGISHLAAIVELRRRSAALSRDVIFLAVADEETGGGQGTGWLLAEHADLFSGTAGVLNEGGSNRAAADRLFWWGVEVAQKRPLWLRVETRGRGGHGSTYNPSSATHQLVVGLANLFTERSEMRLTRAAADYFRAIARFHGEAFRRVFGAPDLVTVEREFQRMLEDDRAAQVLLPGMTAFFRDTLQITGLETTTSSVNVVPRQASALLDIRLLPDTPVEDMLSRLRRGLGRNPTIDVLLSSPPTAPSAVDTDIYRALEKALGPEAPVVPSFITGTTDSRYFRERGIPAYGFSPFVLSGEEVRGIHGPDESIPVDDFRQGLETMRRVVWACAVSS